MKLTFLLTALVGCAAAANEYFEAVANYANTAIHNKPINAAGLDLWIGKAESRYCPPQVRKANGCHNGRGTSFLYTGDHDLFMGAAFPKGQQVFVNPQNSGVHYVNASTPGNTHAGLLKGWTYTVGSNGAGTLRWNFRGLYACGSKGVYQIYAGVANVTIDNGCLGPFALTTKKVNGPTAYEYT